MPIFPGPYLCYHGEPVEEDVRAAHEFLLEVVREEGPFDMVVGFSQGAALAAAAIARHEQRHLTEDLFKAAVFVGASMPFDLDTGKVRLTYDGTGSLRAERLDAAGNAIPEGDDGDGSSSRWVKDCRTATVISEFESRNPDARQTAAAPQSIEVLLRYHPRTHPQRIQIPTVHVVGAKDGYAQQGLDLASLCDSRVCQTIVHEGGHEFPRKDEALQRVADCMQAAAAQTSYLQ
ncbi:hypothetical protein CTA1_5550 [Colletotrichum tanaceti]|uniref:Serine hydrolase domain-containing protein n=1 Tax=Colletotrichum tanaceti TaxID=1306861 RepID=A0A4U6WZS1_9PEZI|nr:hypothetical protein CTA1_5550 [Colletotrichum tanaceti]